MRDFKIEDAIDAGPGAPAAGSPPRPEDPKLAHGSRKPAVWNVPLTAVFYLGKAMDFGANKYGRYNWRDVPGGVCVSTYVNAIMRHLALFADGEDVADDSGVHHLAHIMASCAIVLDAAATGSLKDDRRCDRAVSVVIRDLTEKETA